MLKASKLLEQYTQEPDAFETQSERQMQKELEDRLDYEHIEAEKKQKQRYFRLRNRAINVLEKHFSTFGFIRNLSILKDFNDKRYNYIQFWIPENRLTWICDWENESQMLKRAKLTVHKVNASRGYLVTIQ
jgi:hypothetical protein